MSGITCNEEETSTWPCQTGTEAVVTHFPERLLSLVGWGGPKVRGAKSVSLPREEQISTVSGCQTFCGETASK